MDSPRHEIARPTIELERDGRFYQRSSRSRAGPARAAAWFGFCLIAASRPGEAATVTIRQHDRGFSLDHVSIAAGDTVHFDNDDEFSHQMYVVAPNFGFDSDEQDPGSGIDIRFTARGTFVVHCHIHPRMALRVDVN